MFPYAHLYILFRAKAANVFGMREGHHHEIWQKIFVESSVFKEYDILTAQ